MKNMVSVKIFTMLQRGKEQIGKDALRRVIDFINTQRTADDTFVNKSGTPDLYYTLFGWILAYSLNIPLNKKSTRRYLEQHDPQSLDLIHYAAFIRCRLIHDLMTGGKIRVLFNRLFPDPIAHRTEFTTLPHSNPDSPYSRFISLSLSEDAGQEIKDRDKILDTLNDYRVAGGGYTNLKFSAHSSTNATNAALTIIGQLKGFHQGNPDLYYLQNLQEESGGFSATLSSPIPDLLTTATSLFVLNCFNTKPIYPAKDFIEAHWLDSGGFAATLAEDSSDVEYTFYGLLALGAS